MKLVYHQDPGHGWIEAPAGLLGGLGIAHQISSYSYQGRAGVAYLEEDCDAPKLIAALAAIGVKPDIVDRHSNDSFIRGLPPYIAPKAPAIKPLFSNLAANCLAQKQAGLFDPGAEDFALA